MEATPAATSTVPPACATFEEALEDAKRKYVGENPNILALPQTFTKSAVHLCLKNQEYSGATSAAFAGHPCCG